MHTIRIKYKLKSSHNSEQYAQKATSALWKALEVEGVNEIRAFQKYDEPNVRVIYVTFADMKKWQDFKSSNDDDWQKIKDELFSFASSLEIEEYISSKIVPTVRL